MPRRGVSARLVFFQKCVFAMSQLWADATTAKTLHGRGIFRNAQLILIQTHQPLKIPKTHVCIPVLGDGQPWGELTNRRLDAFQPGSEGSISIKRRVDFNGSAIEQVMWNCEKGLQLPVRKLGLSLSEGCGVNLRNADTPRRASLIGFCTIFVAYFTPFFTPLSLHENSVDVTITYPFLDL